MAGGGTMGKDGEEGRRMGPRLGFERRVMVANVVDRRSEDCKTAVRRVSSLGSNGWNDSSSSNGEVGTMNKKKVNGDQNEYR